MSAAILVVSSMATRELLVDLAAAFQADSRGQLVAVESMAASNDRWRTTCTTPQYYVRPSEPDPVRSFRLRPIRRNHVSGGCPASAIRAGNAGSTDHGSPGAHRAPGMLRR